uniref:Uncharacterized protein n=1 Tax=Acrobeloides nanus TaxID=290746 RepID=A0A914CG19_9BILA
MSKPEFIQYSCYKFMFLIGLIDLVVLPCNAMITGVQCALGAHFCTHPALFFWAGALATAGWYSVSLTCVILAVDRFLEMCWPRAARIVFSGKRVYYWLALPIVYILFAFFHVPFVYNSERFAHFTDPYVGIQGMSGNPAFTIQAMCICIEMFIAALIYVYNQFFLLPDFIEVIAQVSWIGIHGDTPIVYLLLNASLRKSVFKMLHIPTSDITASNTAVVAMVMETFSTFPAIHDSLKVVATSQSTQRNTQVVA